jgi:hypothetical protein
MLLNFLVPRSGRPGLVLQILQFLQGEMMAHNKRNSRNVYVRDVASKCSLTEWAFSVVYKIS